MAPRKFLLTAVLVVLMTARTCHGDGSCSSPPRNTSTFCVTITCYNGECVKSVMETTFGDLIMGSCSCDIGWDGHQCDICCDLDCDLGYKCRAQYDSLTNRYSHSCHLHDSELAKKKNSVTTTLDDKEQTTPDTVTPSPHANEQTTDPETRPSGCKSKESKTFCVSLYCYHGTCHEKEETIPGTSFSYRTGSCVCDEGWVGSKCDQCCDLPCDHGNCQIGYVTDQMYCNCDEGFKGTYCNETIISATDAAFVTIEIQPKTTQERNVSLASPEPVTLDSHFTTTSAENSCKSIPRESRTFCVSLYCYHGTCHEKEETIPGTSFSYRVGYCACDEGWKGTRCDQCCDRQCNHGNCHIEYGSDQMYCDCEEGYMGPYCDVPLLEGTTRQYQVSVEDRDSLPSVSDSQEEITKMTSFIMDTQQSTIHATSITESPETNSTMHGGCIAKPRAESTFCVSLMCYNGECERSHVTLPEFPGMKLNTGTCKCDQGWYGSRCNQCCDLPCDHGQCRVDYDTKQMYCNCHPGYQGKYCDTEILVEDNFEQLNTSEQNIEYTNESVSWYHQVTTDVYELENTTSSEERVCTALPRNTSEFCVSLYCYNGVCNESETHLGDWKVRTGVCICDDGWYGMRCNECCDLSCNNGSCRVDFSDNEMYCNCEDGYMGRYCDQEVPPTTLATITKTETPDWYWYVIGVCIGFLVIFPVGMGILFYVLWRYRVIFIMKIVRYFQSPEGEDDGKLYDACVSYTEDCQTDELFCVRQILPKLEREMDFKLYLPFRDEPLGSARAEEMISAVEMSRRTILLITPEYLLDEWPRFQLLAATHKMLQQDHKIIPVILRDVSHIENIDPVLMTIMKSIRCIRWPERGDPMKVERFWERLRLELPKKKKPSIDNETPRNKFKDYFKFANLKIWKLKTPNESPAVSEMYRLSNLDETNTGH